MEQNLNESIKGPLPSRAAQWILIVIALLLAGAVCYFFTLTSKINYQNPEKYTLVGSNYKVDGTYVYYSSIGDVLSTSTPPALITGADASTFQLLQNSQDYAKDKNHVYYNGAIVGGDPTTLTVLDPGTELYTADAHHVFYNQTQIMGADPTNFHLLAGDTSENYAVDGHGVYYTGLPIVGANPGTFKVLGSSGDYAADMYNIYYDGVKVAGADVNSFTLVLPEDQSSTIDAKDASHYYSQGVQYLAQ